MAQFRPGETGNPQGRPRKPRTGPDKLRADLLRDAPEILRALVDNPGQANPEAVVWLDRLTNKLGRRGWHWGRGFAGAGGANCPQPSGAVI